MADRNDELLLALGWQKDLDSIGKWFGIWLNAAGERQQEPCRPYDSVDDAIACLKQALDPWPHSTISTKSIKSGEHGWWESAEATVPSREFQGRAGSLPEAISEVALKVAKASAIMKATGHE